MTKAADHRDPSARPTSTEQGRTSRAKLLNAAVELISEVGWNAVTTRLTASRAGVRPGLVHYHFDSLDSLVRTAVTSVVHDALDDPLRAMTAVEDPAEGVLAALDSMESLRGGDPAPVLMAEAYLAATRDPELHSTVYRALSETRDAVTAWLGRLGTPQPEAAAELVCALLDGFVMHRAMGLAPDPQAYRQPLRRLLSDPGQQAAHAPTRPQQ